MKLFARIITENETNLAWDNIKDRYDEHGQKIKYISSVYLKEDGWYELEREPEIDECLEYDKVEDRIVIKKREKTSEMVEAEKRVRVEGQLREDLPNLIFQNKDSPEVLAQALCDRAKQIEAEIQEAPGVIEEL